MLQNLIFSTYVERNTSPFGTCIHHQKIMFINSTSTFSFFPMSDRISGETRKRKASEGTILIPERNRLPLECKATVKRHINSIYVGSIVRIYDKKYGSTIILCFGRVKSTIILWFGMSLASFMLKS